MKFIKFKKTSSFCLGISSLLFFPMITLADAPTNFAGIVSITVEALKAVLPVIVILAFIYFLWGLTKYLKSEDNKKETAKNIMLRGMIALFVISGLWGIVWLLTRTFIEPSGANVPEGIDITDPDWSKETSLKSPLDN